MSSVCSAQTRPSFLQLNDVPVFDIRQYGAKVDGVTNDVVAVRAAVDAADSAGGGIVFFPNGTTSIKWRNGTFGDGYIPAAGMIEIKSNITFMGQSKAAIVEIGDHIFNQVSSYIQPLFSDHYATYANQTAVVNVAFRNLTLSGNATNNKLATTTQAFYYLIRLTKAEGVTIEDCNFIDSNSGNVIILGHLAWGYAPTKGAVKNVRISNCLFYDCGQLADPKIVDHSTLFAAADDVIISDCRFENSTYVTIPGNWGRCAVELHGDGNTLKDSTIINYRTGVNSVAAFFDVNGHKILNNVVPRVTDGPFVFVQQWAGVGSQTYFPFDYATRTTTLYDVEIAHNRVETDDGSYFFYASSEIMNEGCIARNINIHDNTILVPGGTTDTYGIGAITTYNVAELTIRDNYFWLLDQGLLEMRNVSPSPTIIDGNVIITRHIPNTTLDGILVFQNPTGTPVLNAKITNNDFRCSAGVASNVPFIYNECYPQDIIVSGNSLQCAPYKGVGLGLTPSADAIFYWKNNTFRGIGARASLLRLPCSIGSEFYFSEIGQNSEYQKRANHNVATETGIVNLWLEYMNAEVGYTNAAGAPATFTFDEGLLVEP